ncbi:MAG: prepilin-type N-terminal cleavage/methylation domain-containing protein [Thermodesulfobacteriota bacterium]
MGYRLRASKGLTLIELLLAMAISAVLIAAMYRTFIGQHRTYTVQEQVVDMQQNARVAINRMMREIRMAGFGNVTSVLPITAKNGPFNAIVNPFNSKDNIKGQLDDQITVIGAFEKVAVLSANHAAGANVIRLSNLSKNDFDPNSYKKYVCIGGLESYVVTQTDENTKQLTLSGNLGNSYKSGTPVFKIKAITYKLNLQRGVPVLEREDNTDGGGGQDIAENIENLQFRYILDDESEFDSPADPSRIRMVKVTVTARTNMSDPEFKGGEGGFRRRTISSNILVRNVGMNP